MSQNKEDERSREYRPTITSTNLLMLSVVSAGVYFLLSYLIFYFFQGTSLAGAFDYDISVSNQLIIGIMAGGAAAGGITFIMNRPPVSKVLHDFYIVEIISNTRLTAFDRTQASLFAGVGEELLFRGALQPLLGVWLTSVIFVGLHGYFKFQSLGHIAFGLMMFGLSVLLGYLFEYVGLIAAMSAHAAYDMIMLYVVQKK